MPTGVITSNVSSFMTKNLFVFTKISPTSPFSFEEEGETLTESAKVEFIEYRGNMGYSSGSNINQNMFPGLNMNMNRVGANNRFGSVSHDGKDIFKIDYNYRTYYEADEEDEEFNKKKNQ
jgi:hypothetical protein